jgi:hypothetical protein
MLEEIVSANNWLFDRSSLDELVVEVAGRWTGYRMFFFWHDDVSAMQFSCQFDLTVAKERLPAIWQLMALVNERLWLGHFDIDGEDDTPIFRHTTLLRGSQGASTEQLEDLMDIALSECERFYPAFQLVVAGGLDAETGLAGAIIDTVAEA